MLKIVADENIILASEAFSSLGNVFLLPGRKITNKEVIDADILLVRSVTKVDKNLLNNSKVKFVGTATIGRDHIDQEYLTSQGIFFIDAAGCNADAVAEYVFTSLFEIASEKQFILSEKSIGIIGVGNIGSRVSKLASSLGMKVLKNDPPLKRLTKREDYIEMDEILECDIITLHVPLNMDGVDKTFHLFDHQKLEKLKEDTILINASRGAVINNKALLDIKNKNNLSMVLDVWENEPNINNDLLQRTNIATPHIAGYSYEGKVNGTVMLYNALCNFLNKKPEWEPVFPEVPEKIIKINFQEETNSLQELFSAIYRIKNDDKQLRNILELQENKKGKYFDKLRKDYPLRREFSNYFLELINSNPVIQSFLKTFGFNLID